MNLPTSAEVKLHIHRHTTRLIDIVETKEIVKSQRMKLVRGKIDQTIEAHAIPAFKSSMQQRQPATCTKFRLPGGF